MGKDLIRAVYVFWGCFLEIVAVLMVAAAQATIGFVDNFASVDGLILFFGSVLLVAISGNTMIRRSARI